MILRIISFQCLRQFHIFYEIRIIFWKKYLFYIELQDQLEKQIKQVCRSVQEENISISPRKKLENGDLIIMNPISLFSYFLVFYMHIWSGLINILHFKAI
ncbi:unnamed protein product [Paramecium octaurelia]|uniref:Uncharacterized protein n=1 Tax=Paramecium octaurelia TaxID=43137 RepID=A0A8S1VCN9_PAROT|nr:unnamed protein product [Paramecium octaurelia]